MRLRFTYVAAYIIIVNVLSLAVCVFDKSQAKRRRSRISERSLWAFAIVGGSPLMYLTMRMIHHKTRHKNFMIGIPVIFVVELLLVFTAALTLNIRFI